MRSGNLQPWMPNLHPAEDKVPNFRRDGTKRPSLIKIVFQIALYGVILAVLVMVAGNLDEKENKGTAP